MPQQEARTHRHSASCKYPTDLPSLIAIHFSPQLIAVLSNSQINFLYFSLPCRKLISWRMINPTCRMIFPTYWRRRRGWSLFLRPTNPSARSPHSLTWPQISQWSPFHLLTPPSPLRCPSHRPTLCPHSLPVSQPSPQLPTPSSPAAPALSSPPPLSPAAWLKWQI